MLTPDGTKYRIRYGGYSFRDAYCKVNPRNTMVTIEKGEGKDRYVYFGIARCKLSVDRFVKKEGREIALTRALAVIDCYSLSQSKGSFYLDPPGTMGYVHVRFVKTLLKHFESLDTKE